MQVKSTVKLNMARIRELTRASVTALEKTAEALHTENRSPATSLFRLQGFCLFRASQAAGHGGAFLPQLPTGRRPMAAAFSRR